MFVFGLVALCVLGLSDVQSSAPGDSLDDLASAQSAPLSIDRESIQTAIQTYVDDLYQNKIPSQEAYDLVERAIQCGITSQDDVLDQISSMIHTRGYIARSVEKPLPPFLSDLLTDITENVREKTSPILALKVGAACPIPVMGPNLLMWAVMSCCRTKYYVYPFDTTSRRTAAFKTAYIDAQIERILPVVEEAINTGIQNGLRVLAPSIAFFMDQPSDS